MRDLIDRQAAIDFIDAGRLCNPNEPRWSDNEVVNFLKTRPSAQPERKRGEWIEKSTNGEMFSSCSVCGYIEWDTPRNFCPNCGSDNRGEEE